LLRSRGVITSSDAQQATGLDAAGVRPHLQQLVQQGLAVTEGQRRGMRYRRLDG
jgi:predicted ArsR family transcriptional regulator